MIKMSQPKSPRNLQNAIEKIAKGKPEKPGYQLPNLKTPTRKLGEKGMGPYKKSESNLHDEWAGTGFKPKTKK